MDRPIEHEICGNCKKEIPQHNYVMHTAHCARNITLCQVCKEPIPKSQFDEHKSKCVAVKPKKKQQEPPPTVIEKSQYYQERKSVEDKKMAARNERQLQKYERLVDTGYSLKTGSNNNVDKSRGVVTNGVGVNNNNNNSNEQEKRQQQKSGKDKLLACKFCELELPKLELEEHENYCGARTERCSECGELVMFKYRQIHMDSNHGFLKLKDEPGPRASWDSTQRSTENSSSTPQRLRPAPFRPFTTVDATLYSFPATYSTPPVTPKEKGESYKEISRRLDCPAPQPPRRRNPPTELTIPCEFCHVPIPHEDLIQHETGCRPDLARYNPRRKSSPEPFDDDYFVGQPQPSSPEVELPCEFCADMIPASQLLRHQATCN